MPEKFKNGGATADVLANLVQLHADREAAADAGCVTATGEPVNFSDVLTQALRKITNLDHVIELFTDVAPHSRHVAELRGEDDELGMYGGGHGTVDPHSIVGLYLRRCCLDFERLTFEGTCKVFTTFTFYLAEGCEVLEEIRAAVPDVETAEVIHQVSDWYWKWEEDGIQIEEEGAPKQHFDVDGLRDTSVAPPAAVAAFMAKRIQRADASLGLCAPGEMETALEHLTRVAPRLPRAHHMRHVLALQSRDFPAAEDHLRRHFDYLAMGDEGGGLQASDP
jgi:anaphase-promoting complex subunit 5